MDNYSPYGHDCVKSSEILSAMEELFKHFSPFFFSPPLQKDQKHEGISSFLICIIFQKGFP